MSETAVSEIPSLAPCVAGLRSALAEAELALARWVDEQVEGAAYALDDAGKALSRARRMASEVCQVLPSHSRRARRALHAVEQVEDALRRIETARAWEWPEEDDPDEDVTVADLRGAMAVDLRRAIETARRAVDAAAVL